ncbi:globin domain-containing protein [Frankia sp. CcI49]|uniref:globin domain-containing protein n=1 Tax=Frankia sp. CcI49 TaxID=1745382 RepID=UPI0013042557|nr:globin domain-containing protein [Frankia sp. CcI49]
MHPEPRHVRPAGDAGPGTGGGGGGGRARRHGALATDSRLGLLAALRAAGRPLDARELSQTTGFAVSTVRFHLDVLVGAGLVSARPEPRSAPGRPRVTYSPVAAGATATDPADDDGGAGYEHEQLLFVLAENLADTPAERARIARRAGQAWASRQVENPPSAPAVGPDAGPGSGPAEQARTVDQTTAVDQAAAVFAELGFDPEVEPADAPGAPGIPGVGRRMLLHSCPFRAVAAAHPDVICSVHAGLLSGLLERLGSPLVPRVVPFVEPDLCIAHLDAPPSAGPAFDGPADGSIPSGLLPSSIPDPSTPSGSVAGGTGSGGRLVLSIESAAVVRATAPVVAAHSVEITSAFYPRLFSAHPELLRLFNQGNQANGDQRRALAASVVAYATQLIDPQAPSFQPVLERIAHKHASLGVLPEQYTVVGRNLLAAVGDVLGDAVTPEIAAAWDEVYWLFACQLIAEEARVYQRAGVDPRHIWRPWEVIRRTEETPDVISLLLLPADGQPAPPWQAGQYVSVAVDLPDGRRQPRQYTISTAPGRAGMRLTVRRVRGADGNPDGAVSSFLHDSVDVGTTLDVSQPFGDVVLDDSFDPLLLVSAGIGITPMVAMLDHVTRTRPDRRVVVAHADHSPRSHPVRDEVRMLGRQLRGFEQLAWYEQCDEAPEPGVEAGLIDADKLPVPDGVRAYLCGPLPFMRDVRASLLRRGVPAENIRYEVFGPDLWAGQL